jgi:predicted RNase H-like HicB family nuclease
MNPMDYLVVIEKGANGYGGYVPDLPGVGAAGRTLAEVRRLIRRAVELHIEGLRQDQLPLPQPKARSEWVIVASHRARGAGQGRTVQRRLRAAAAS